MHPLFLFMLELKYSHAFNSRYLGFFHAPGKVRFEEVKSDVLSIPVTWDFSMHHKQKIVELENKITFNSRYLGFFHAPNLRRILLCLLKILSIPVTWDFSMHQR